MRICHVTCVHKRYDVRILEKECVSLAKNGYETFLVLNDNLPDEHYKGVNIVSTGFVPKSRGERLLRSARKVLKKALEIDAELYHLHDPELLSIATKLTKRGKKVIFDSHEDTEIQIKDKQWIPSFFRGIVSKTFACYFKSKAKNLSGIVTVTPAFVEKFKQYNNNVILVTNYPLLEEKESTDISIKLPESDYVFFAGDISEQWNHEIIVKAVEKCGLKYCIAGKGEANYISMLCENACVEYLGVIPHDSVKQYLANAVAGMALSTGTQAGTEGTLGNTKLFETMLSSRPVICTNYRLWKEIVDTFNCGISVNPRDVESIVSAIRYLKDNSEEADEMGKNGKSAICDKYNWGTQEKELLDLYKKIM